MNTKPKTIALEGTHIGDDLGGPCGPGESFRRFLFEKMIGNSMESQKVYRLSKRKPLAPKLLVRKTAQELNWDGPVPRPSTNLRVHLQA